MAERKKEVKNVILNKLQMQRLTDGKMKAFSLAGIQFENRKRVKRKSKSKPRFQVRDNFCNGEIFIEEDGINGKEHKKHMNGIARRKK